MPRKKSSANYRRVQHDSEQHTLVIIDVSTDGLCRWVGSGFFKPTWLGSGPRDWARLHDGESLVDVRHSFADRHNYETVIPDDAGEQTSD